jgi:NADH dehydrogenase [ubiquinone] 1 alpha subcomplex assembly factor 7
VDRGCVLSLVRDAAASQNGVVNALKRKIIDTIRAKGPISVADYMRLALIDPEHGYYMTRDPLGRDFTTAPEVSQIFGELIGLFFVQAWEDRGSPSRFHFVELGPGRGTLMADMLRAAGKVRPEFVAAAKITLVEISPFLRGTQAETLSSVPVKWVSRFDEVPNDLPLFLIGNEIFDALPIRQFVKSETGWHERMVKAKGDDLEFAASPDVVQPRSHAVTLGAPSGSVLEVSEFAGPIIGDISRRFEQFDGVALIVDYGYAKSAFGDTLQAVKDNAHVDPLAEPGEADLTAHVDFEALARAAQGTIKGPVSQAEFLEGLGIRVRAELLKRKNPQQAADIDADVCRLTHANEMGTLFKTLAICEARGQPTLPGFDD